jgi:UDP-N-acetylglucosamine acyltransferase
MAYSHVAHDCHVGNGVVMANAATLAGHVIVEDQAILGGLSAVHQFARIGEYSMIGGGTMAAMDVPPYTIVTGDRKEARMRGLNLIGLKRHGFSDEVIGNLKKAYKILTLSGLKLKDALERIKGEVPMSPQLEHFVSFIESAQRGICR